MKMEYEFEFTQEFENNESVVLAQANFCSATGYSFKDRKTNTHFNENYIPTMSDNPLVLLNGKDKRLKPKDDSLFVIISSQIWYCKYGEGRRCKSQKKKAEPLVEHQYARKPTRQRLFTIPKLQCGAKLHIREALCFPYEKAEKGDRRIRRKYIAELRKAMHEGRLSEYHFDRRFIVSFPRPEDHSEHPTGEESGGTNRVDNLVINKIHEVVATGETRPREVGARVEEYINEFLPSKPSSTNRQFSPTKKDLYNHIQTAVRNNRNSEEEQVLISDLLEELKTDETDSRLESCWFRPKNDTTGDTFLLVMSTQWQRRMLEQFGSAVLLDATYKTNKFDLPLYQLAVRTNSVYVPVGFIVTQDQTTDSLQEGMEKFASFHKDWKPEVFIIDDDQREKNVIQKIFAGCRFYICHFHVKQAWKRWLKRIPSKSDQEAMMSDLSNIMSCLEETDYGNKVQELRAQWGHYTNFMNYMDNFWLCSPEPWAMAFRPFDQHVGLTTNNGVERLHSLLKSEQKQTTDMSITGLIKHLMKHHMSRQQSYYEKNEKMKMELEDSVPGFLAGRGWTCFDHCRRRLNEVMQTETIHKGEEKYQVNNYSVVLNRGTKDLCSCQDFRRHFFPCKHILATLYDNSLPWEALPEQYRDTPMLHVSKDCRKSLSTAMNLNCPKVSSEHCNMSGTESSGTSLKAHTDDTGIAQGKQTSVRLLCELRDVLTRCNCQETVTEANQSLEKIKKSVQNRNCFMKRIKHRQMPRAAKNFLKSKAHRKYFLNKKKHTIRRAKWFSSISRKAVKELGESAPDQPDMASVMTNTAAALEGSERERTEAIDLTSESDEDTTTTQQAVYVTEEDMTCISRAGEDSETDDDLPAMASFMAKPATSFEGGKRKRSVVIDLTRESENTTSEEQDDDSDGLPELKFEGRKKKRTLVTQTADTHTTKKNLGDETHTINKRHSEPLPIPLDYQSIWRLHSNTNALMTVVHGHKLTGRSFGALRPGHEVTDEILNAYCSVKCGDRDDVYLMDCLVATDVILKHGQPPVLRNVDLLSKEMILAPYVTGKHWQMFVVYPPKYEIVYINPMGEDTSHHSKEAVLSAWRRILRSRCKIGLLNKEALQKRWKLTTVKHQLQQDSTSCGIYVMKFVDFLLDGENMCTPFDTTECRTHIASHLLQEANLPVMADICRGCSMQTHMKATKTKTQHKKQGVQHWVQCESCRYWYHLECSGRSESLTTLRNETFVCSVCQVDDVDSDGNRSTYSSVFPRKGTQEHKISVDNPRGWQTELTGEKEQNFQLIALNGRIKKCQGSKREFHHPPRAPLDIVVRHLELRQFFSQRAKRQLEFWTNSHYHCRAQCILTKNPHFTLRRLVIDPNVILTDNHIQYLTQNGIDIMYVINSRVPYM